MKLKTLPSQILISLCMLLPTILISQTYQLVKDINVGANSIIQKPIGKLGNQFIFYANNGNKNQIWVTDGTEGNTQLILESQSSFETTVREKFIVDGVLYFYWYDEATIYSYDGTTLTNLANNVEVYRMNEYNNDIYFIETTNSFDNQLMKVTSDPDMPESVASLGNANMKGLTTYNGQMIIMAANNNKTWLFSSDGTTGGTVPFLELGERSNANYAEQFMEHNGSLYFFYQSNNVSNPPPVGFYKTDGTSSGTIRLADTYNYDGALIDDGENRSLWHDNVLYTAGTSPDNQFGQELWTSDGTIGGTNFIKNLNGMNESSDPKNFVMLNGVIYFTAKKENGKNAIWKTDGTENGTTPILEDIFSTNSSYYGEWLSVYDNQLVFGGFNPAEGSELWFSDGTVTGTFAMTDESSSGNNDFLPKRLFVVNHLLYFSGWTSDTGRELWVYDNGMPISTNTLYADEYVKVSVSPNPFAAHITFVIDNVPDAQKLYLQITDLSGKLINSFPVPENKTIEWNPSGLPSGILFYQLFSIENNKSLAQGQIIKM
jgi:ELWxxDGT repeat protein